MSKPAPLGKGASKASIPSKDPKAAAAERAALAAREAARARQVKRATAGMSASMLSWQRRNVG